MSADTLMFPERGRRRPRAMPSTQGPRTFGEDASRKHAHLLYGSVDCLDTTARLEAAGFGDKAARLWGEDDTFRFAARLGRPMPDRRRETSHGPQSLPWRVAGVRGLFLVAGVLTAAAAMSPRGLTAGQAVLMGVTGWVSGQVVGAAAWRQRGLGRMDRAAAVAAGVAMGTLATAVTVAVLVTVGATLLGRSGGVLVGSALVLGWASYAVAAAIVSVVGRLRLLGTAAVLAACVAWAMRWNGSQDGATLAALLLLAVAVAEAVRSVRRLGVRRATPPDRADVPALVTAGLHALLLAACLLVGLGWAPARLGVAVTVAVVVAAALVEPAVVALAEVLRRLSSRGERWGAVRATTAVATVVGLLLLTGVADSVAWLVVRLRGTTLPHDLRDVLAAVTVITVLNVCGAVLIRAGRDRAAAVVAGVALLGLYVATRLATDAGVTLAALSVAAVCLLCTVVAARAGSHPHSW
jgi:hypothetical protein